MGLPEIILPFLQANASLISFLVGMISEETLIFLAILSGADSIPLWVVGVFGFLGAVVHDTVMYHVGKRYLGRPIARIFRNIQREDNWIKRISFKAHENVFLMLFFSKFVYGVRLAMLWYIAGKEKNYLSFIKKDFPAVALTFAIILPAGWLAGHGFSLLLDVLNEASYVVFWGLAIIVAFFIIRHIIRRIKRHKFPK